MSDGIERLGLPDWSEINPTIIREGVTALLIHRLREIYDNQTSFDAVGISDEDGRFFAGGPNDDASYTAVVALAYNDKVYRFIVDSPEWPNVVRAQDTTVRVHISPTGTFGIVAGTEIPFNPEASDPRCTHLTRVIRDGTPVKHKYISC